MSIYLETSHLILRDWQEKDIVPFAEMNKDERVMEYFLKKLTDEESFDFYRRIRDEFEHYGFGLYAVECKADHRFLGYAGFHNITFDVDFAPGVEIGWRLIAEAWGMGYATEAAAACLEYARVHLKLDEIYSFTSLPNKRSERVMQKIGMKKIKEFGHPLVAADHSLHEHVLYGISLQNK